MKLEEFSHGRKCCLVALCKYYCQDMAQNTLRKSNFQFLTPHRLNHSISFPSHLHHSLGLYVLMLKKSVLGSLVFP